MKNELSASYSKALDLHNKILVSAQLAQNNLWDMCAGLKEMRDGKLYKELGYQNFEAYCGTEFNMSRRNAYYYISIVENMKPENVKLISHFGTTKLFLLSSLSESEQAEITAENDVENMTVKQLEAEIRELKTRNKELEDAEWELEQAQREIKNLQTESRAQRTTIDEQADYIREMEARPIEVAVAEPSDDVRRLKETIRSMEADTARQMERMENEHIADVRQLHERSREEQADLQGILCRRLRRVPAYARFRRRQPEQGLFQGEDQQPARDRFRGHGQAVRRNYEAI